MLFKDFLVNLNLFYNGEDYAIMNQENPCVMVNFGVDKPVVS